MPRTPTPGLLKDFEKYFLTHLSYVHSAPFLSCQEIKGCGGACMLVRILAAIDDKTDSDSSTPYCLATGVGALEDNHYKRMSCVLSGMAL